MSHRLLVATGVAVPILYFGTLIISSFFFPGYSHATQYASELGSAAARWPIMFNAGIFLTGVASIAAATSYFMVLGSLGVNRIFGILVALCIFLLGLSLIMGAMFPMPDPRHGAFGLGMGVHLAPMLLALSLRSFEQFKSLNRFLWVTFILLLVFFLIMMGVGGLVTSSNVGIFQRVYALTMFSWIGVAAWMIGNGPTDTVSSSRLNR